MLKTLLALLITIALILVGCARRSDEIGERLHPSENNLLPQDKDYNEPEVDMTHLKSYDGQLLIYPTEKKEIPPRPSQPELLPPDNARHWFDIEYPGWVTEKINMPVSPGDGPKGKKVSVIVTSRHPYWTAVGIGAKKVADAYEIDFKMLNANQDLQLQNQYIDEAIEEKVDMILLASMDTKEAITQAKKINDAGIPLILFNTLPESEALKYCLAWSGPDDWANFEKLSRVLADKMNKQGGVGYLRHTPVGGSPYYSRTWAPITELMVYAPEIITLVSKDCAFDYDESKDMVLQWIDQYGYGLKGIVCSDDSIQAIGAIDACKEMGRGDIIIVASGNGKHGMDAVKNGDLFAITYQSAEADGALPMKVAADWFKGEDIQPIYYLSSNIITRENVDKYMPAQW
ncbi:sugar ABC transporter substrate-binding protein [Vallitalea pronyensis]|uniref:Sugar ABC transporter substrate-binding protein n=1 Tax=Vallitalea pronyensis TaxID=1348613 RepID=A0A8J8SGL2_9FIRM|nr:sugar ABC transporter substrate-binding protein [Vallitalea pronyensis]QUI22438.1 sugar ABC transporter substrate-binding protein [Vallitalea pronyensis]